MRGLNSTCGIRAVALATAPLDRVEAEVLCLWQIWTKHIAYAYICVNVSPLGSIECRNLESNGYMTATKDHRMANIRFVSNSCCPPYIYICVFFFWQVLAALAYSRNPAGLHFTNPSQWTHNHLFAQASIWDIPVVKAPFSCRVDLSLSVAGYDLATELQGWLHAFRHGARCDRGFVEIPESRLAAKSECEFCEASPNSIPAVKDYSVSVMYRTFSRDAQLFNVSFPTVLKHFPDAYELIVVVEEVDADLFELLISPYQDSSPYPLRVVTEPTIMEGHIQQKYSKASDPYND